MTDEVGFEPTVRYERTHTFQACALNHSATRPGSCVGPGTPPNDDAPAAPAHRVLHGQSEIRTHDTVAGTPVFETGAFNHSAICPSNLTNLDGRPHTGNGRVAWNGEHREETTAAARALVGMMRLSLVPVRCLLRLAALAAPLAPLTAQVADSFPRPDRPVSRIVAPRWIAEDRRDALGEADSVMRALRIVAGTRVADIGAGDGYYVQRLSERVGPTGLIYGEDIELRYLELLRARVERGGWTNVRVIEGREDDPALPPASIDVALMIHMYHEITSPFALLHRLAPAFRAGGQRAVLDVDGPTDMHGTPPRLLICGSGSARRTAEPDARRGGAGRPPSATSRATAVAP